MPLKYKSPIEFDKIDYRKDVIFELESGRELNALFLIHGYIEAYLTDWLLISGPLSKTKFSKRFIKNIERIDFPNLTGIHLIFGHISETLYTRTLEFNKLRNKFAHELISIDFNNKKTKKQIKDVVMKGIKICDEISTLYKKAVEKRAGIVYLSFKDVRALSKNN